MDLLQRLQRWYTINCNSDWEHAYGLSITTLDNPGWAVKIDLRDTCLQNAYLEYCSIERGATDWASYIVKEGQFEGMGGPDNLSEVLTCFLDTFLPGNIEQNCTIEIGLPVIGYEGQLWLNAEGKMISESTLKITAIEDYNVTGNYLWSNVETLKAIYPKDLKVDFAIGDKVEPYIFQADDNMLRTFLVAPAKK